MMKMKRLGVVFSLILVGSLTALGCAGGPEREDDFEDEGLAGAEDEGGEQLGEAAEGALPAEEKAGDGTSEKPVDGAEDVLPPYCDDVLSWNATWTEYENQVLALVNQRRAAGATCGGTYYPPAPPLTFDERLRCAARKHSKDMGVNNFFSHTGSNGSTPWNRITSAGYAYTAAAENIAAGQSSATQVVNGWMNSSGHCRNIMKASLQHLGTGYYYAAGSSYRHYWTQDFGKP